jgi:hypothetical protein
MRNTPLAVLFVLAAAAPLGGCTGAVEDVSRDDPPPPGAPSAPSSPPPASPGPGGGAPTSPGTPPPAGMTPAPGTPPPATGGRPGEAGACRALPRRLVPLSPRQLAATAARLVEGGLNATDPGAANHLDIEGALDALDAASVGRFSTAVDGHPLGNDKAAALLDLGGRLGDLVFSRMGARSADACVKADNASAACIDAFVGRLGRRAFRRPLAPDEAKDFTALYEAERTRAGARAAVSAVAQAMFLSPSFLFRTELGDGASSGMTSMTSHETAQALSYWLLQAPPDAALEAAADADKLKDPAERVAQVRRLLAKPAPPGGGSSPLLLVARVPGLRRFFYEWLELTEAPAKEDRLYGVRVEPEWAQARQELEAFISDTLWNRGGKWDTLLTDNAAYVQAGLVHHEKNKSAWTFKLPKYPGGICDPAFPERPQTCDTPNGPRGAMVRVEGADLDGPRAGLLTSPLVMSSHSLFDRTDAVLRGKWVRHALLCSEPPPPPPTLAALPPPPSPTLTARERFAQHAEDPSCAGCHRLMDPIGYALESYDAVGRFRTHELSPDLQKKGLYFESGRPIDPSGVLAAVTVDGKTGDQPFRDASELARTLVRTEDARRCFVTAAHGFAVGRFDDPADRCARDGLLSDFEASGRDVLDLFARIAAREDFILRGTP